MVKSRFNLYVFANFTFVICWILWVIWFNFHLDLSHGDSINYFCKHSLNFSFLQMRYHEWSSRLLIESVLVLLSKKDVLFLLCNSAVMVTVPFLLWSFFDRQSLSRHIWLFIFLVSFYPITNMSTAGWRATFVNYYWPLAAGILSLHLQRIRKWWVLFLFYPMLLFACNHEQSCVILTLFCVGKFLLKREERNLFYDWTPFFLCLISLLFIATAPGNASRQVGSTIFYNPGWLDHSLFYKGYAGFFSTLGHYYYCFHAVFLFFSLVLALSVLRKFPVYHVAFVCPTAALLIQLLSKQIFGVFDFNSLISAATFSSLQLWVQFFISIVLTVGVFFSLYVSFQEKKRALTAAYLLATGLVSRFILGLAPSIFASSERTYIFLDFILMALTLMVIEDCGLVEGKKQAYVIGVFSFIWLIHLF